VPGLVRVESRPQALADQPPSGAHRFGRRDGWVARYRATGRRGILTVQSRVDVFAKRRGATEDLSASRSQSRGTTRPARLGDEGFVTVRRLPGYPRALLRVTVAWRERNATSSLAISGFTGEIDAGDATALARRLARRLKQE